MSENTSEAVKPLSKEEIEERLKKAEVTWDTYQAAMINKFLTGSNFKLDLFEQSKKRVTSSSKFKSSKKKISKTSKPPDFLPSLPAMVEDTDLNTPGSLSSGLEGDLGDGRNSLLRRTSRRERRPATKPDLGYEEPKPIKGVKLSGASREIFRKWEEILIEIKDNFGRTAELAEKATNIEQEISNLRNGKYKNTYNLGNAIRKWLNTILSLFSSGTPISTKLVEISNKFEDSFASLDNKILFEESKTDSYIARKKSGNFGAKKKGYSNLGRSSADYDRPMTGEEKKNLSRSIRNLTAEQLKGIIWIVKDMFPERNGMLEFDIDILPPNKWRELEEYVRKVKNEGRKPPSGGGAMSSGGLSRQRSGGNFASKNKSAANSGGMPYKSNDLSRRGGSNGVGMIGSNYPMGGALSNSSNDSDSDSSNSSGKSAGGLEAHN